MHDRKKGCGRGRVSARSLAGRAYHVMASVAAPLTFSPAEKRMSSRAAASAVAGSSRASDNGTAMAAREAPRLPTTALRLPTNPPPDALARVPGRAGARAVRALYATSGAHPPARAPAPLPPAGARRARPHHGSARRSGNPPRSRGCVLHCVPKKATTKSTETLTNTLYMVRVWQHVRVFIALAPASRSAAAPRAPSAGPPSCPPCCSRCQ